MRVVCWQVTQLEHLQGMSKNDFTFTDFSVGAVRVSCFAHGSRWLLPGPRLLHMPAVLHQEVDAQEIEVNEEINLSDEDSQITMDF